MITLSVIIPTRNRAKYLQGALNSLTRQTYPPQLFEILVVDNGSSDHTKATCDAYQNRIPNLRYCYDETPGLHVGRHVGMKMAKSDILVYADDDIEAFTTWLAGISESFQAANVALVGGKVLPKFEREPPPWVLRMWHKDRQGHQFIDPLSLLDLGDKVMAIDPFNIYGCNFSIRRSVLEEAEGFHPDAMPDNMIVFRGDGETHISQFIKKKGYMALYDPKASVFHIIPKERLTEAYFCRRAYLQGISDSYTQIRNTSRVPSSPAQRLIWYLRLSRKKWRLYSNARRRHIENDYYEGYCMHQHAVKADKTLYAWVTKKHYMDVRIHEPLSGGR